MSLGWALPLLLKDRAASPLRGPLTTLSHSQGSQRRGAFPLRGSFIPPCMCSFSHCDFALLPTHRGVGEELPRKHGLGQVLAFLTFRDSCMKEGNRVFSPRALFLPPPPSPQAPWLALAPRASPPELWVRWVLPPPPHGKMSQASPQPPLLGPKPSGLELCKATEPLRLSKTPPVGEGAFLYLWQSGSRPVGVSGRTPVGEESLVSSLA